MNMYKLYVRFDHIFCHSAEKRSVLAYTKEAVLLQLLTVAQSEVAMILNLTTFDTTWPLRSECRYKVFICRSKMRTQQYNNVVLLYKLSNPHFIQMCNEIHQ